MVNWKNIHLNWRKFCLKVRWILPPKQRVGKRPHVSDVKVILKIWVPSMTSRKTSWEQLLEMDKEAYEYHYPSLYYNRKTLSTEKPGGHRVGWLSLSGVSIGWLLWVQFSGLWYTTFHGIVNWGSSHWLAPTVSGRLCQFEAVQSGCPLISETWTCYRQFCVLHIHKTN